MNLTGGINQGIYKQASHFQTSDMVTDINDILHCYTLTRLQFLSVKAGRAGY